MKKLLTFALAACLAATTFAQTAPAGGLFGTPTNFSGSYLVQRKSFLAVAEIPIKVWSTKYSQLTFQFEGLGGYNASTTSAAIGTAVSAHWAVNSFLSLTVGVGATIPVASFTWSQVNQNTVGLLVGASVKF
jgi:hypothetical protein